MLKNIKAQLKKIARAMAKWPIVGRFVKICGVIIRLPELRDAYMVINHRQHVLETEGISALQEAISALGHRQHVLETEQIPALQETILAFNHHQPSTDNELDNLVKSVPVALRKITRELADIRIQLESTTTSNSRHAGEA